MKIQYQADDGRLFSNEQACIEYEQRKKMVRKSDNGTGYVRRRDLDGVIPLSNHGVYANFYTWFEVHSIDELRALLKSYGHSGEVDGFPHFFPDLVCISSSVPTSDFKNVYFRHSLEDEVYKFWVQQMGYDGDDFDALISERQFM